jgi:broad specificity phosphatase PhoE
MELYIIRHGQSTNNVLTNQNDRVCDPPLTELGQRQAEVVAQHLATADHPELSVWKSPENVDHPGGGYGITKLFCSPMWRTLQTAQPIGKALGLDPEVWIDLHEHGGIYLDHGEAGGRVGYPGKTRQEILVDFPNYLLPEKITNAGWWNQDYEEEPACHGRAIKVGNQLRQWADSDERIGLVSHGGFIDALLKALFSQLPGHHLFYSHYNTAITRIDFLDNGQLILRYLNRVHHLPPALVSG